MTDDNSNDGVIGRTGTHHTCTTMQRCRELLPYRDPLQEVEGHVWPTLKLYGRMNRLAMPSPWTRRIHSSKFLGFPGAVRFATLASISPVKQEICTQLSETF